MLIHPNYQIVKTREKRFDVLLHKPMLDRTEAEHFAVYYMLRNIDFTVWMLFGVKIFPYQSIILRMMLQRPYILNIMTRGGGKCISGDSICCTKDGFFSIEELCHKVAGAKENIINIFGENGFQYTSHTYVNPKEKLFKITTSNGYTLSGTSEHPIRIIKDGEIIWKKMGELSGDENVVINRDPNYTFKGKFNNLSPDFGYLLGLLVGDGCFSKHKKSSIGFTNSEKDIVSFFEKNVSILDNNFYFVRNSSCDIEFSIHCKSRKNKLDFLQKYGLSEALAGEKEIPSSILRSNKEVLSSYIAGYADADGGMTDKGVEFSSKSHKMLYQLQIVLLSFGIISKLRCKTVDSEKYWVLLISSNAVSIYAEKIGFRCIRKKEALNKYLKSKRFNPNKDLLRGCKNLLKSLSIDFDKLNKRRGLLRKLLSSCSIDLYDFSYEKIGRILELTKECSHSESHKKPQYLYDRNFYFDRISTITQTEEQTSYDVCVPNGHNFLSNGFISHNTYLNGLYGALKGIITPGTKLLGVGSNRRQARFIFAVVKNIYYNKRAVLFREVARPPVDAPEESKIDIIGSDTPSCLSFTPLANGDRIRGFRASVLMADEANIISEDIFNTVLRPMLAVGLDPVTRVNRVQREKELIAAGVIKESDTIELDSNQIIMSSSAGYKFSFLYEKYKEYKDKIIEASTSTDIAKQKEGSKYGVIQLSYEAINELSPGYLNMGSILADKATFPSDKFISEYGAQFPDDSNGFIPRSMLEQRQIPLTGTPIVESYGKQGDTYILAIDPSSGENTDNDFFGIVVLKLDMVTKTCYCVNATASAGKGWPFYVKMVKKFIKDFDPKYIIIDSYGGGVQLKSHITHSDFVDTTKGEVLLQVIDKDDLKTYCHAENRIVRMNTPTNQWNEQSNVHFKSMLEHGRFWFANRIQEAQYGIISKDKEHGVERIDELEEITETIELAKTQISAVVPKQNQNGLTIFVMPDNLGAIRKQERTRKDLYSACLLGAWGAKEYIEITEGGGATPSKSYNPVIATA